LSTRSVLQARNPAADQRQALQAYGRELDERTNGRWIRDEFRVIVASKPVVDLVVVDSVRIAEQIEALREAVPVLHIHLTASREMLEARYEKTARQRPLDRSVGSYAELREDPTESRVDELGDLADLLIDTGVHQAHDALALAVAKMAALGFAR
jgi:hypothetical protein